VCARTFYSRKALVTAAVAGIRGTFM
jgi:hypothetical protein